MKQLILLTALSVIGYVGGDVSSKTQTAPVKGEEICPPQSLVDTAKVVRKWSVKPTKIDTKLYEKCTIVHYAYADFVSAVIYIESRGYSSAYNIKEEAVGVLQIRPIMLREVNRVLRKNKMTLRFELSDRWNRQKSIDMFDIMAEQVNPEGMSQMQFFETVARRWNGGRRGDKKKATIKYWERIKNQIKEAND